MQVEGSTVIKRPVSTVWDFYAVHHVENHPPHELSNSFSSYDSAGRS